MDQLKPALDALADGRIIVITGDRLRGGLHGRADRSDLERRRDGHGDDQGDCEVTPHAFPLGLSGRRDG